MQKEGESSIPKLALVFGIGILLSTPLSFSQFFKQGSIGGILYFIGERSFSSETPGIANASINGALVMRPYGTFPHPNVLAWYVLVGVVLCVAVLLLRKRYVLPPPFIAILILATIFGSATILVTFSRSMLLAFASFIVLLPIIFFKKLHAKMLISFYVCFLLLLLGLFALTPLGGRVSTLLQSDKAITERSMLLAAASKMSFENPIVGVGIHNFIVRLPDYYSERHVLLQPVHNIYLLVLVEVGIVGLGLLLYVFWRAGIAAFAITSYQMRGVILFLFISALLLGMADHYMLTLEQSQILFTVLVALCFAYKKQKHGKSRA